MHKTNSSGRMSVKNSNRGLKRLVTNEDIVNFYFNLMQDSPEKGGEKRKLVNKSFEFKTDFQNFKNACNLLSETLNQIKEEKAYDIDSEVLSSNAASEKRRFSRKQSALQTVLSQNIPILQINQDPSRSTLLRNQNFNSTGGKSLKFNKTQDFTAGSEDLNQASQDYAFKQFAGQHQRMLTPIATEASQESIQTKKKRASALNLKIKQNQNFALQQQDHNPLIKSDDVKVAKVIQQAHTKENFKGPRRHLSNFSKDQNRQTLSRQSNTSKRLASGDNFTINQDLPELEEDLKKIKEKANGSDYQDIAVRKKNRPTSSYLNKAKTEENCFPDKSNEITKSNDMLFHNRVKSMFANNAPKESSNNLRKSISDSNLEKNNEQKMVISAKLNLKSEEDAPNSESENPRLNPMLESRNLRQSNGPLYFRTQQGSLAGNMRASSAHSVKSIHDQNYRIKQLKLIETTLKEHFKYGIVDVGNLQQKPLLSSRALNSNQLRQHAFEEKVESYLRETNQIQKLIEFQRAKHLAATMFDIVSGHPSSIDHSITELPSNPGEKVVSVRKSESSFFENQRQNKRLSKDVQRKNEILLQQQVMLSLSPRLASNDSDITKLVPTLINLPDDSEIIQQLEGLVDLQNIRRVAGSRQPSAKAKTADIKSPLDNAIKSKKINLSSKPPISKNKTYNLPNNYQHNQTIPEEEEVEIKKPQNRIQSAYTRQKASKQQLTSTFISSTQNLQSAINQSMGQLSPKLISKVTSTNNKDQLHIKMIASKEIDMQLVKIGESTDGSDIMKYTAWNNQQRNMPLKIQFQVEPLPKPRRVQSANYNRAKRLTAVQPVQEKEIKIDSIYMKPEQAVPTNDFASFSQNNPAITDQISKSANQRPNMQAQTHGSDNMQSDSQQIVDNRYSKHSFYHPQIRQSGDQKRVILGQQKNDLMFEVIEEKSPKHQSMDQTKVDSKLLDGIIEDGELNADQNISPKNSRLRASGAKSSLLIYEQQNIGNIMQRETEKRKSIFSRQQNMKVEESADKQSSNKVVTEVSTPFKVQQPVVENKVVVKQRPKTVTTKQPTHIISSQLQLHPIQNQLQSQADLQPKHKSQARNSGQRKTFGQRIGELVTNFDKKFILTNQELPEAIKHDLQATKIKPQSAMPRYARGVRPLTGKAKVPVRSIEKSQPLLLDSALFDSAQPLISRKNSTIQKKNSACTDNLTFENTKGIHSPNDDIDHVVKEQLVQNSQRPLTATSVPKKHYSANHVQLQLMLNQQTEQLTRSISPKTKSKKPTISQGETLSSRKTAYSPSKQPTIQVTKPLEFLQGTAILINKDEEISEGAKFRTRPGFIVNKDPQARQPSIREHRMAQNLNSNKHKNIDIAHACEHGDQIQGLNMLTKQVDEYSINQETPKLNDLTLSSPTLNSKTDISIKQSIRNINLNDPIYTKGQASQRSIEESFFVEEHTKIAKKQIKSKVRIQSGKTAAQHKLLLSRIQHENVPPKIIAEQSNARRHQALSTRQIASVKRFKGNPQFMNSQTRMDFTYGDLESFFKNLAKSTKTDLNTNMISKNAILRVKGYFLDSGSTNSHLRVQRNINAKNKGICSKGRPFKSNSNSVQPSHITSPVNMGMQIKSRSPVGQIRSSQYHNHNYPEKTNNTLQTIGQASALSRNPRLSPVPQN